MPKTSNTGPRSRTNRAPEPLVIVQDFLNTSKTARRAEVFESPAALSGWLVEHRLLPAGPQLTEAELALALETREGIRALLRAGRSNPVAESVLRSLDRVMGNAVTPLRFTGAGGLCLKPIAGGFGDALGHLFGLVVIAMFDDQWTRLAACANAECRTVFWDESRRRSRRWCQRRCGDVVRSRAYRQSATYRGRQRRRQQKPEPVDYSDLGDLRNLSQEEIQQRLFEKGYLRKTPEGRFVVQNPSQDRARSPDNGNENDESAVQRERLAAGERKISE